MVIVHRRRGSRSASALPGRPAVAVTSTRGRVARGRFEGVLWGVALLVALWLGYAAVDRAMHDRRLEQRWNQRAGPTVVSTAVAASHAVAPASAVVATRRPPDRGEPIARLEIPGAGVSVVVAAGTDARTLRRGVGHIDGTALPGEPGNIGLAGHRDTVFRGLRKLRPGDRIRLVTAGEAIEYTVESLLTVTPDRSDVLDPSPLPTLTLVTCYPFDFVGPAPMRYIVRAREVGRVDAGRRPAAAAGTTPAAARRR